MPACKGKNRRREPCGKLAMVGRDYCRTHGGTKPRGAAHPQFKHGKFSKSLPIRFAATYQEALDDADLLSLKDEAALLETQIHDALGRVSHDEAGALWLELRERWAAMMLLPAKDRTEVLAEIGALIERGSSDVEAWREVRAIIRDKERIAASERRRLVEMRHVITAEQLAVLVGMLSAAILSEVRDRETRARILTQFDRAIGGAGTPETPGRGTDH